MNWRILGTGEAEEWHAILDRLPCADVFHLPGYHAAHERNGDGHALAFVAEEGSDVLFHPFLVRPVGEPDPGGARPSWYDIETVYGYSGPLCTTADGAFLGRAWSLFGSWCRTNRVVAEFVRFNPLLGNHPFADGSYRVVLDRQTVALRLDGTEAELWDRYPSVQRNMVCKAQKKGLVCEEKPLRDGGAAFRRLYQRAMDVRGASRYYYFSDPYFRHLFEALGDKLRLFVVRDQDRAVAAALFLLHQDRVHYHLAGSDPAGRAAAPNNLLLHTAALWARARGFRWLHLGGGRTANPQDSLFRFKASLSPLRFFFYIGMRVHDPDVYERLCAEWMGRRGLTERPKYFQLYRLGGDHEQPGSRHEPAPDRA